MNSAEELILTMVKPLVAEPDEVTIDITDGDEFAEYHLKVAQGDLGRVIGRQGRIIQAIRTIVYSVPVADGEKKVRLLVDEED